MSDRLYSIYVEGFGEPARIVAATASKARYRAYLAWRDAGYGDRSREPFREFVGRITTTLHLGPAH